MNRLLRTFRSKRAFRSRLEHAHLGVNPQHLGLVNQDLSSAAHIQGDPNASAWPLRITFHLRLNCG